MLFLTETLATSVLGENVVSCTVPGHSSVATYSAGSYEALSLILNIAKINGNKSSSSELQTVISSVLVSKAANMETLEAVSPARFQCTVGVLTWQGATLSCQQCGSLGRTQPESQRALQFPL